MSAILTQRWNRFKTFVGIIRVSLIRGLHHKPRSVMQVLCETWLEVYGYTPPRTPRMIKIESGFLVPPEHVAEVSEIMQRQLDVLGLDEPYENTHDC